MRAGTGRNGMATIEIDCEHGRATVYLQGAHVTSWVPAGGDEALFVSDVARFAVGESIRGGVPVAFPQFAELGPLPMHGFAHTLPWQWTVLADAAVRLTLRDSDATRAMWPHRFAAELDVELAPRALRLGFAVRNLGSRELRWAGTLHTFVALDAPETRIRGLGPGRYVDRGHGSRSAEDVQRSLRIPGHTDRAYLDAGPEVDVDDGRRRLVIGKTGFRDTVVWNPGRETSPRFSDLQPDDHRRFVCIEAAEVRPVTVPAGGEWRGSQTLLISSREAS
ncbi:MAG: D-hexose-6-phosphate mutarotase [Burkholderiaceae bacterium]